MGTHQELVARNIKRFRAERGLSMAELARRAGLAKQTLATVEQGRGNPTIETVALVADALDVSLRRLVTEWGTQVFVQRKADAQWLERDETSERQMSEVYGSGYIRTLLLQVDRRRVRPAVVPAHAAGELHHAYVISGRVKIGPEREPVEVGAGDFVRYPADVPHVLCALTERATLLVVSSQPQLRQTRMSS